MQYPVTPDGRYFVVRGRLWRCANPALSDDERTQLVQALMAARRAVGIARRARDASGLAAARAAVDAAKRTLGERGPVWWTDGAPDYNRRMVRNSPYATWYAETIDSHKPVSMAMSPVSFDLPGLGAELDARRESLGLTWQAIADELGISVSTLRGLGARPVAEGDGVLRVLAWLGRSAESFVANGDAGSGEWSPPAPAGRLRFDVRAIYAALDAERAARGQTWSQVAAATGFGGASALTRLREGGRVMFPAVMRVLAWLGAPAARFVRVEGRR